MGGAAPTKGFQFVDVPGQGTVEFPERMSDDDIASAIKSNMPKSDVSENEPSDLLGAPARLANSALQALAAPGAMQTAAQGPTFGMSDEIGAEVAAPFIYGLKNVAHAAGGPYNAQTYQQSRDEAYNLARAPIKEFQDEHPVAAAVLPVAAGVATGGALAKLAESAAPETAAAVAKYAAEHPYIASAGLGAGTGSLYGYGTAEGSPEERLPQTALAAGAGGVAGPLATLAGRTLVGPAIKGAGSLLDKVTGAAEPEAEAAVPAVSEGLGSISGRPVEETQPVSALTQLATEKGNVIRLPAGVKDNDTNALRVQEEARQGVLGDAAQSTQKRVDSAVIGDTKDAMQSLVGPTTADSGDDLLYKGISAFKKNALNQKAAAGEIMQERNDAIAQASIYKGYTHNTLTQSVNSVLKDPQNAVTLETVPTSPINAYAGVLNNLTKPNENGQFSKPLDFAKLQGWSSSLSAYARANAGSPDAVIANQMVGKYNEWLDNISRDAIKEGDEDVGQKILAANKNYAEFKAKFGTNRYEGESPIINDIIQKDALTPRQLVNTVFGTSVSGKDVTGQIVGRMMDSMPDDVARANLANDFRSGLLMRALQNSQNADGSIKIATLSNNLDDVLKNDIYKTHLSSPEYDKAIKGLAIDLRQYSTALSDPTVRSTSGTGGVVTRMMTKVLENPVVNKMTAGVTGSVNTMVRNASLSKDRAQVHELEKQFFGTIMKAADSKSTLYGGLMGGQAAGQAANVAAPVVQQLQQ